MLALTAAVLLTGAFLQGEETPAQRAARLKRIPAADLAAAYLANEYTLTMIGMARQGATVQLDGGVVVTAATADSVAAEYQQRQETYASVIRARAARTLTGPYTLRFKQPCDEAGFFAVEPRQNDFRITLRLRHDMGLDELSGVLVEDVLMLTGDDPTDNPHGRVRDDKIELAGRNRGRCTMVLARGAASRPAGAPARLEQPESVLGLWEGKWDGQFGVRFTISRMSDGYQVLYEWQEYEGGAFAADTFQAYASSGRSLRSEFGTFDISFEAGPTPQANAVGHFGLRTRRARLTRTG